MQPDDETDFLAQLQSGQLSYEKAKERYRQLGEVIRKRYEKEYTAVSVDVVQSRAAKLNASDLDAQITFDAYHKWVDQELLSYGAYRASWSGDGLLALFEQPETAVWFGQRLLEGLPLLNERFNHLRRRIQIRIGVHTGAILEDESRGARKDDNRDVGKIASRTFDLAGHLQKAAAPDQMLISDRTFSLVTDAASLFAPVNRDLSGPMACFAYPPHTAYSSPPSTSLSGAASARATTPAPAAPAGSTSALPWIIGMGAVGLAGFAVAAVVLVQRNSSKTPARLPTAPAVIRHDVPAPSGGTAATASPVTADSSGAGTPATPSPRPAGGPTGRPAPVQPAPAWQPATVAWRSPDATSGLPGRVVPSPPELRWALCIGAGQHADATLQSPGGSADARTMAGILQRYALVPPSNIRVLGDHEATVNNIKLAFQWLQQRAISGRDTVFVYLGGAAAVAPDRPGFRHPSGTGYVLLPFDAQPQDPANTAVYGADIAAWLAATRAQTLVVFADTPYAGMIDVPAGVDPGRQFGLIAAASGGQRALGQRGASGTAFIESLAAALRGGADLNRDRKASLQEIQQFLRTDLPSRTGGAQVPEARAGFGGYLPELEVAVGG